MSGELRWNGRLGGETFHKRPGFPQRPRVFGLLEHRHRLVRQFQSRRRFALERVQLCLVQQAGPLLAAVAELLKDGETLKEHLLGLGVTSLVAEHGAQVVKDDGLAMTIVEGPPDRQALLERLLGLIELTLAMIDLAQVAKDVSLVIAIADPATDFEAFLVHFDRFWKALLVAVNVSEVSERLGLAHGIAGLTQHVEGLNADGFRLIEALAKLEQATQVLEGVARSARVTDAAPDSKALLVRGFRFPPPALLEIDQAQVIEREGFAGMVAGAAGRVQGEVQQMLRVVPVASDLEEIEEGRGELKDRHPVTGGESKVRARDQVAKLGFTPVESSPQRGKCGRLDRRTADLLGSPAHERGDRPRGLGFTGWPPGPQLPKSDLPDEWMDGVPISRQPPDRRGHELRRGFIPFFRAQDGADDGGAGAVGKDAQAKQHVAGWLAELLERQFNAVEQALVPRISRRVGGRGDHIGPGPHSLE